MNKRIIFFAMLSVMGSIKAMDKKPIEGKIIICPDRTFIVKEDTKRNSSTGPNIENIEKAFGISVQPGTRLVSVWVSGSGVDNWYSNVHSLFGPVQLIKRGDVITSAQFKKFPAWIPELYVNTLQEGESISFEVHGNLVTLTAAQLRSRYKAPGKFEEALKQVTGKKPVEFEGQPKLERVKRSYGWWPFYGIVLTTFATVAYGAYTNKLHSWVSSGKSMCMNSLNWFTNKRK
ncbi:MAG: hypothetical protein WCE21_01335 [Candidatus Babeliales bacterium]